MPDTGQKYVITSSTRWDKVSGEVVLRFTAKEWNGARWKRLPKQVERLGSLREVGDFLGDFAGEIVVIVGEGP